MLSPEKMRDEAMRLATAAGFAFREDSGPTDALLSKVGLAQATPPAPIAPERAKLEMDVLEMLDARGLRIPAMFAQ